MVTEAARLWIGDALVLPSGVDKSWSLPVLDSGRVDESHGKQAHEDAGGHRDACS